MTPGAAEYQGQQLCDLGKSLAPKTPPPPFIRQCQTQAPQLECAAVHWRWDFHGGSLGGFLEEEAS